MSVTYPIDYYQVNIGVGDCEIILLVKDTPPSTTEILKAVIIDGGKSAGRITNIEQVIRSIGTIYKLAEGLKFDAVVITHWDADHYMGILTAMIVDLDKQEDKDKGGTKPLKVSFLKYKDNDLISILYVPYKPLPKDLKYPVKFDGEEFGFDSDRKRRVCRVIADMDTIATDLLKGHPKPFNSADTHDSRLIGRELFSGDSVVAAKSANSPDQLLDAYKTNPKGYKGDIPGLFCVAVNNRYLPPASPSSPDPSDPQAEWRRPGNPTLKNRSSIVCVVIRPNGSVSHYLAGDARSDLEAGVVEWTGLAVASLNPDGIPPPPPDIKNTVPVVKISHHGAPSSFPLNLCQTFKPSVILFSAGNLHLHPGKL